MDRWPATPVAVVGGGPIGLLLALFLDHHGVRSVVFDTEKTVPALPRGSSHNARTMEHYRTLGLAAQVRRLGLPWEHPTDISFRTRYTGFELARDRHPSPAAALRAVATAERFDQVPEPMHRANQMYVEKLLVEHAATRPNIETRYGWEVIGLDEQADGVEVTAARRGQSTAQPRTLRAAYVVGCDGGHSFVRRHLGVAYTGPGTVTQDVLGGRTTAAHLRVRSSSRGFFGHRRAWGNWAFNADLAVNLIALDGADEFFLLSSSVKPDTGDIELVRLVRAAAGVPAEVKVLSRRLWTAGAALVAERFGAGRLLLAGDAAHLFTPNGGFGMNTGVDDVANLSWKLAAAVQGWAGPGLLGTYESERRPIALRNTAAARELNLSLGTIERPSNLEDDSADGAAARARTGTRLAEYSRLTVDTIGVQLGARYDQSPIVDAGSDPAPSDAFATYTPSGVPGGRAPHVWLDDAHGRHSSLFDRFGTGFTLLCLRNGHDDSTLAFAAAAKAHGIPLSTVHIADDLVRDVYGRDLVLIRPDHHVAWRGDRIPGDVGEVVARAAGHC
ncbi:FAD-dependent monooxygenase [Kibdelosporangium phytohabitans]|uniref:Monooxygenase n=1 Tax=Kibdelosporangium phytohabitans TaxID=860235 RepID=A0A0N9I805_9PSEU|nr:FAD-dependent monooxygenase [Kibdelosporangium phytohabitans]ALG15075.1 monooxygenase [Kibdelosporangium phytohabitans]MBE1468627.1 2-polyprenyl-6-methoxyphenol hydroxylase-like FAD-dependent oxidoreductase [Kibdelosporangium phytohabitans]